MTRQPDLSVLSYGGGVQTRALLLMALDGQVPMPSRVIFADTHAEPGEVYRAVEEDRAACVARGVPFDVVSAGDLSATDQWGGVFIPAFTLNGRGDRGMLRRQCTQRFKVAPIRRRLRELGATAARPAELWLGISTDEAIRAKPADVRYVAHRWPLIELDMSRDDCLRVLASRGVTPTKSACVFCPYRGAEEWRRVRSNPADWSAAVAYDEAVRNKRPKHGAVFVHRSAVPLSEAPVLNDLDQPDLFGNECGGYCGL